MQIGQPFKQTSNTAGSEGVIYSVIVKHFQCGILSFPFDASSASGLIPKDVPAHAAAGKQFCEATPTVQNTSTQPITDGIDAALDATVTASGADYTADTISQAVTYTLMNRAATSGASTGYFSGDVLNPGDSATQYYVWQIQRTASATSLNFANPPVMVNIK